VLDPPWRPLRAFDDGRKVLMGLASAAGITISGALIWVIHGALLDDLRGQEIRDRLDLAHLQGCRRIRHSLSRRS
jgi:hypothetical protein